MDFEETNRLIRAHYDSHPQVQSVTGFIGSPLNRLTTDASGIAAAPVVAADTLVAVTRNGGIYGFRPD